MAEHTPGSEWRVERVHDLWVQIRTGYGYTNRMVADCVRVDDARLIIAAPDLLAACEEFVRKCENGEARSTRSYAQMKAAIAKAKGGTGG